MSVSRSGHSTDLTYSDHEVHHISHGVKYDNGADAGPNTLLASTEQFEITLRGLEPDELAELRAMRVALTLYPGGSTVGAQDEIGAVDADFSSGFNMSQPETVWDDPTSVDVDVDDSGTDDFRTFTNETDEVGNLTTDQLSSYIGYSDTTDGTGGSGSLAHRAYVIDFADMFGSGPYVDAVDDFSSIIRLAVRNCVADISAQAVYSLYYNVSETESGRSRFGR